MTGGYTGGSVSGDTWHYRNDVNRTFRAQWLANQIARVAAFNAAPAPQVTVLSLNSEHHMDICRRSLLRDHMGGGRPRRVDHH